MTQTETKEYFQAIARTIQEQIGRRAFMFIGACNFACGTFNDGPGLRFKIKASRSHKYCRVVLIEALDTYTVTFISQGGNEISKHEGIYGDMLTQLIANETGLSVNF
jgi:hypothetical protein